MPIYSPIKTLQFLQSQETQHKINNNTFKSKYEEIINDIEISDVLHNIKCEILNEQNAKKELNTGCNYYRIYGNKYTTLEEITIAQEKALQIYPTIIYDKDTKYIKPKHMPLRWYGEVYPYIIIFTNKNILYNFILDNIITDKPWDYIYKNEILRLNQHLPEASAAVANDLSIKSLNIKGFPYYYSAAYESIGVIDLTGISNNTILTDFNNFRTKAYIEQLMISLAPKLEKLKKYNRKMYAEDIETKLFESLSDLNRANEIPSLRLTLTKEAQSKIYIAKAMIGHLFNRRNITIGHYYELTRLLDIINNCIILYIKHLVKDSKKNT